MLLAWGFVNIGRGPGPEKTGGAVMTTAPRQHRLVPTFDYGENDCLIVIDYDVRFQNDSSTNGCREELHVAYDQEFQTPLRRLRGGYGYHVDELGIYRRDDSSWYISGKIKKPRSPEDLERNRRSLTIHLEEAYSSEMRFMAPETASGNDALLGEPGSWFFRRFQAPP